MKKVAQYGMGRDEKDGVGQSLSGDEYTSLCEEAKRDVDRRVQKLLDDAYSRALRLLEDQLQALHWLAGALVEFETLDHDEIVHATLGHRSTIIAKRKQRASAAEKREQAAQLRAVAEPP